MHNTVPLVLCYRLQNGTESSVNSVLNVSPEQDRATRKAEIEFTGQQHDSTAGSMSPKVNVGIYTNKEIEKVFSSVAGRVTLRLNQKHGTKDCNVQV